MSRSRRKNPIRGLAADSDKDWKKMINRSLRRRTHMALSRCPDFGDLVLPVLNDIANAWDSPKDGKTMYTLKDALRPPDVKYWGLGIVTGDKEQDIVEETIDWVKRYYWK